MEYLAKTLDLLFIFVVSFCIGKVITKKDYLGTLLYVLLLISYLMLFYGLR